MNKAECRAALRATGNILSDLPPSGWPDTVRKLDVLRAYAAIERPTRADVRAAAERLGVRERGFYRLVRVYEELGSPKVVRGRRGSPRRTDPRVDDHIRQVAAELGPDATAVAILREVGARCARDGLTAPSASMLLTRLDDPPERPDVRGALRIGVDLVLDVAPLPIPLLTKDGAAPFVQLGAIVDAAGGQVLSWRLAAPPFAEGDVRILVNALPERSEPLSLTTGVGLPRLSTERRVSLLGRGVAVLDRDPAVRVGAALRAVFGRHLGRIRILEVAPPPGRPIEGGVPIEVAREVVDLLIVRRNAEIADAVSR